jgi:secondary thiamine-phosphate synthase enzyme
MHTLANAPVRLHVRLGLTTGRLTDFLDLTDRLDAVLADAGVRTGILNVQTTHTTTGIVVNEDEPLLRQDFEGLLAALAPRAAVYRHDDLLRRTGVGAGEPLNGHAHCRALLLPTSACLNVADGRLQLGRWQRVLLVELDGPRNREVSVVVLGEALA